MTHVLPTQTAAAESKATRDSAGGSSIHLKEGMVPSSLDDQQIRSSSYLLADGALYWIGGNFGGYASIFIDIDKQRFCGITGMIHKAHSAQNCELLALAIASQYAEHWLETDEFKVLSDCSRAVDLHNGMGAPKDLEDCDAEVNELGQKRIKELKKRANVGVFFFKSGCADTFARLMRSECQRIDKAVAAPKPRFKVTYSLLDASTIVKVAGPGLKKDIASIKKMEVEGFSKTPPNRRKAGITSTCEDQGSLQEGSNA